MVFALETYCPASDGVSAARIEEEVLVTEDGNRILTRFPGEELLVAGRQYVRGADIVDEQRGEPWPSERPTGTGAAAVGLERDEALELYRRMLLIRRFEDTVQSLFQRGEVHGTTHLYSGQEAVATGVGSVLGTEDSVAGTYRGHGHALSLGVDPQALLDEMLGRVTGVCGGRAGSMNVIDLEHRLIGCFGIVGGSIAAATGAALALKRTGGVAVAYFGDGATNQGYFHECLNFARSSTCRSLRLREQPLRRVHAEGGRDRRQDPGPRRDAGAADERRSTATTSGPSASRRRRGRARPRRRVARSSSRL